MFTERNPTSEEKSRSLEVKKIIEIDLLSLDLIDIGYILRLLSMTPLSWIACGYVLYEINKIISIPIPYNLIIGFVWFICWIGICFTTPMPAVYIKLRKQRKTTLDGEETIGDIPFISDLSVFKDAADPDEALS